jgi:NAD(P)-dependent dehydrogenase (short-subunit alcohol dehydrogenase family)
MTDRPEEDAGVADADLSDTTVLVTGSTSGIGREAALAFGRLGAEVLVHGRDEAAGETVVAEIERSAGDAEFFPADFTDVTAVRNLADAVRAHVGSLDVLANNAGGYFREAHLTEIGVEQTFHVNHLASYLLTADLLPSLASDARVVTTSSGAHRGDPLDVEAVTTVDDYASFGAYQQSKLANVLFTKELARRFERSRGARTANCFHPGAIPGSNFARSLPGPIPRLIQSLDVLPFVPSPADGAATLLYLAVSDRVADVSGRYFADCAPATPDDPARDREAQRRLWTESAELLGIPEPLQETADETASDEERQTEETQTDETAKDEETRAETHD